ncbi:4'-phosphopantetheinyl transferase family protein [Magnetococcus sp. PR-3]|uniref:4'-phosphopantetheinyl transferase family protein n=1 Tax=Magnetococcus sp. PR-3 TaxID=3120355 RepID=UPI002FCE0CAA
MGEVEVDLYWVAGQANIEALARQDEVLDATEQDRIMRYVRVSDKRLFRAAHVLLRRSLSRHANISPEQWRFISNRDGRPEIDHHIHTEIQPLRFNLSHTGHFACCGITREVAVGVDVEQDRRIPRVEMLAKRFFAPAEAAVVAGLDPALQVASFLKFWTLKEAALKATGGGLRGGLDLFSFQIKGQTLVTTISAQSEMTQAQREAWRFVLLQVGQAPWTLAVAVASAQKVLLRIHPCCPHGPISTPSLLASSPDVTVQLRPNLG